jgi:predicted transcriptional regulator
MTDEEGNGRAPSAAPPESLEGLTEEIERTRKDLGETVEALAAKADVTARAREKATEVAGRVSGKASQLKDTASQVKEQAAVRMGSAADRARQRQVLLAVAAAGALLAGWLAARRHRR